MSTRDDIIAHILGDGDRFPVLRKTSTEAVLRRRTREIAVQLHEELEVMKLQDAFKVTVPDESERAAYLESAGGDMERAIGLARFAIPHGLAREHPDMPVLNLARLDLNQQLHRR